MTQLSDAGAEISPAAASIYLPKMMIVINFIAFFWHLSPYFTAD
jgi:hypothetical protein